ncbi:MAG: hypothetical protein Q7O66_23880 [Dehalococcoidia bacterium]|nr:hypothetical protein [Dehalococcoidia bacterium]
MSKTGLLIGGLVAVVKPDRFCAILVPPYVARRGRRDTDHPEKQKAATRLNIADFTELIYNLW